MVAFYDGEPPEQPSSSKKPAPDSAPSGEDRSNGVMEKEHENVVSGVRVLSASIEAIGLPSDKDGHDTAFHQDPPNEEVEEGVTKPVVIQTVSWLRQLRCVLKKNALLLWRRPITLFLMVFSSVFSVLLAWPAGTDYKEDFPPQTECGSLSLEYVQGPDWVNLPLSLNDSWRSGARVGILALGPMLHAICAFIIVQSEIQLRMWGVLRGLGLRDSVYWMSWYIPFTVLSVINSLLAAIVAKNLPVHALESTYFGGIFTSFFFLDLALMGASLFLSALCGTVKRVSVFLILLMMVSVWIPAIMVFARSPGFLTGYQLATSDYFSSPVGLFWLPRQTAYPNGYPGQYSETGQVSQCHNPILSEKQGKFFKTPEEREQVSTDEFFLGCYSMAGFVNTAWNPKKRKIGLAILFMFPYFHFTTIWGNFLGYTAQPGNEFSSRHLRMTPEELAVDALPSHPSDATSYGTTLFPQGSTLQISTIYPNENDCVKYNPSGWCEEYASNCPNVTLEGVDFCPQTNCNYAPNPSPTESKSALATMGFLLALSIMYTLLALYWGLVFSAGYKFYFPFQPSFWFGGSVKEDSKSDDTTEEVEEGVFLMAGDVGVTVNSVKKVFGSFQALKGVTLQMARGEVTAILGHNGAGKTTLTKVMCCELSATDGDISIFGHSVANDLYAVRQLVGVCKQDNFLYPNLNAKEHLELFAGLRGVKPTDQPKIVQEWLESVDLDEVQLQYSSGFSGGMKRRLSLALATIGDRPLIVLDEPTTGMDPVSRRFVWRHIDAIKKGRVVLLTTHAMEEADLLADMVAVLRKGELAAWGSPLELKTAHGSALQFSLLVRKEDEAEAEKRIRDRFATAAEWVTIIGGDAGNITVNINTIRQGSNEEGVGVEVLADFVAWLESEESLVSEYGFSNSSLEEVFLNLTAGDTEETRLENAGDEKAARCGFCCSQGRRRMSGASPDITPAVEETGDCNNNLSSGQTDIAAYTPTLSLRAQLQAIVWHNFVRDWTAKRSIWNWVLCGLFIFITIMMGFSAAISSGYGRIAFLVIPVIFLTLMLLCLITPIYGDRSEGRFYLMRTQGLLSTSYLLGTGIYAFLVQLVYGLVLLSLYYATPVFREPKLCDPYEAGYYACYGTFGDRPIIMSSKIDGFDAGEFQNEPVSLYAYLTPGNYGKVIGTIFFFAIAAPGAVLSSAYLPGYKFAIVVVVFIALAASLAPLIAFIFLNFKKIYSLDYDSPHYDPYSGCLNKIDPNDLCTENIFTVDTTTEEFLNCVGLRIVSEQGSLNSLCIPAYGALSPQFGAFQTLTMALISEIKFVSDPPGYVEQVLIPSMARGTDCSGDTCVFPYAKKLYLQNLGYQFLGAVILLLLGVFLAYVFAFPSRPVLQTKHQISALLSCGGNKGSCNTRRKEKQEGTDSKAQELEEVAKEREAVYDLVRPLLVKPLPAAIEEGGNEDMNPAVAAHAAIQRGDLPPVLMHKLRKVYPSLGGLPPKVALKSLDLHVPKGQVLGLLGQNGAGKTTALKILANAHDASSGVALVAGYDVSCEKISVFERLGNCPQFDVVWKSMSVQHHLELFAKLKGLPRTQIKTAARDIATAVGLGLPEVYTRNAGALSGGMRRRLSIAISLIGAPKVLLLDEPTTGLDPSTRNSIWGLVNSFATEDRAIIITTHMMIEADTLCNRIAIVSKGELVVVASQQHLKDRFGSGYLLQLNLVHSTPVYQKKAMAFTQKYLHSDATLGTKQAKTLHVHLPRDLDLKKVFTALYSPESASEGGINQFLLSQSSLEDVFISLGS